MKFRNYFFTLKVCITFIFIVFSFYATQAQTDIAFQGFEEGDSWQLINGTELVSDETGSADTPVSSRIKTGLKSWQVNNQEALLELAAIDVSGYQNVSVILSLSSTSTSSRNGADGPDYVKLFVDQGNGYPDQPDLTLTGTSNARWDYSATLAALSNAGQPLEITAPQGGTNANNYASLKVQVPDGAVSVKLKLVVKNDAESEFWNFDDITIVGDPKSAADAQAFIVSTPQNLTEINLNDAILNVSLTNETFQDQLVVSGFTLLGAPTGLAIKAVDRTSDAEANLTLAFEGADFDEDYPDFAVRCEVTSLVGEQELSTATLLITAVVETTGEVPLVFFSEYIEGSGYNKALEIFNGTGQRLDMDGFVLKKARNGEGWGDELVLSGWVSRDDVYVVFVNDSRADSLIKEVEGDEPHAASNFNGDDAVGLFFQDQLIDIIGNPDEDPGAGWKVNDVASATAGQTLVRKTNILQGNSELWSDGNTGSASAEWDVFDEDDFTNLGFHRNIKVWSGEVDQDWHNTANWGGGIPEGTQKAVIPAGLDNYPILSEPFNLEDLEIDPDASLLGNSFLTMSGTCKAFLDLSKGKWQYFGIPVQLAKSAVAADETETYLVEYNNQQAGQNESGDDPRWVYIVDENFPLDPAKGYGILVEEQKTLTFEGVLNSGDQLIQLSKGETNWELVSNPFISALDWTQACENPVVTGTAYLWEPDLYDDSDYGSYILINSDGVILGNGNQSMNPVIPPMQGFFVDIADDGQFCFAESARVHGGQAFLKSASVLENFVRLNITHQHGIDELVVYNKNGASSEYDRYADSRKMFVHSDKSVEISSLAGGEKLSIDVHGEGLMSRPLCISASKSKEIVFSVIEISNLSEGMNVILIDKLDDTEHELSLEKTYTAFVEEGETLDRFELKIGQLSTAIHQISDEIHFYLRDEKLYCTRSELRFDSLEIYDLQGRKLTHVVNSFKSGQLELNLPPAIYLVRVKKDRKRITKKLVVW